MITHYFLNFNQISFYLKAHSVKKLQIGSSINLLPGWLNSDLFPSSEEQTFLDARKTFPFEDKTFDCVFSEHQLEHLTHEEGSFMLKECYRILKTEGKINIKGKELNPQELLNATHTGTWLTDAKRYFSKPNCVAKGLGEDYISASVERQEFLETALNWINNGDVQGYMALHRNDENAKELHNYFANVIEWIGKTFTTYRREMKNVNWGELYNQFKDAELDAAKLEKEITKLLEDEEVGNQKGIYDYVLTRNERSLNLRTFDDKTKRRIYEKQKGICPHCGMGQGQRSGSDLSDSAIVDIPFVTSQMVRHSGTLFSPRLTGRLLAEIHFVTA